MVKKILLIGGGGHCLSVLDSLLESKEYNEIAIIDTKDKINDDILGVKIIGTDEDLTQLFEDGYRYAFISIGSIGNPKLRIRLYNLVKSIGYNVPIIADKSSVISKKAKLSEGVYVGKGAIINVGSVIRECAIINTGAIIEHECIINEFAHISPGTVLSGNVKIGKYTHIGTNSTVRQSISIGEETLIGSGSNVVKDIGDNTTAYGNPCREVL